MKAVQKLLLSIFAFGITLTPTAYAHNVRVCKQDEAAALAALSDFSHEHILLVRHGVANSRSSKFSVPANCKQRNRFLENDAPMRRLKRLVENTASATDPKKMLKITKIYTSEVCRAVQTGNAYNVVSAIPIADLNPPRNNGSAAKTKAWLEQQQIDRGSVAIAVSHSDIIPDVVSLLRLGHPLENALVEGEAVVLRKTPNGLHCEATIPPR